MFFILSKTVSLLLLPSNFLIALGLAGLIVMLTRYRRAGIRLASASLLFLALIGFLPVGSVLTHVLENRFPPWDGGRGAPDGIVVLGGAIAPDISQDRGVPVFGRAVMRITAIAKLARQFPNARIVYSGGNAELLRDDPPEASFIGPLLDDFGVPRARVVLESRSRNTFENAVFVRDLVKPKAGERWLLVTSAEHMPRAVGCFRRAGFPVEAYPVDWRTKRKAELTLNVSLAAGLQSADAAVHEWIGLVAYWLSGRTSELLPGPAARD